MRSCLTLKHEESLMTRKLCQEEIKLRLEAAKAAQERTRLAFFAHTIIGLCLLAVFWNSYASIYKDYVTGHYLPSDKPATERGELAAEEYANAKNVQSKLMENWVSSRFITVSLL